MLLRRRLKLPAPRGMKMRHARGGGHPGKLAGEGARKNMGSSTANHLKRSALKLREISTEGV
jgi:hypothetical protein